MRLDNAAAMNESEAREAELRGIQPLQLAALIPIPSSIGSKLRVAQLRFECALRGLETSGYKADLVARLNAYSVDVALASAKREAELKK